LSAHDDASCHHCPTGILHKKSAGKLSLKTGVTPACLYPGGCHLSHDINHLSRPHPPFHTHENPLPVPQTSSLDEPNNLSSLPSTKPKPTKGSYTSSLDEPNNLSPLPSPIVRTPSSIFDSDTPLITSFSFWPADDVVPFLLFLFHQVCRNIAARRV
jgi:hypothetical protein